jgi:hypothetical protein
MDARMADDWTACYGQDRPRGDRVVTEWQNLRVELAQFEGIAKGKPQGLYLDSGAQFVDTWTGTPVLVVTQLREWNGYTPSGGWYQRCYITGRDLANRTWYGYGMGRNMLCRMRLDPTKLPELR